MIREIPVLTLFLASSLAPLAHAAMPPMPGMTNGGNDPGMKHVEISLSGSAVAIHNPHAPLAMTSGLGADYMPAKFDVLENRYFNAQPGWIPGGFESPGAGEAYWIKRIAATQPAGSTFRVYEAGNGLGNMNPGAPGAETMAEWTMTEIYTTNGYTWMWDEFMQHDYYVADLPGDYSMTFEVYVGDETTGVMNAAIASAQTTLSFTVVPEPSAALLVAMTGIGLVIRRW